MRDVNVTLHTRNDQSKNDKNQQSKKSHPVYFLYGIQMQ